MKPTLTLNVKAKVAEGDNTALQSAAERKTKATETIEDAWIRVLLMKNSDSDAVKLREVKHAMTNGLLGREPQSSSKRFSKAEALRLYSILAESQREAKLAELVEKTPSNYHLLTNMDDVESVIRRASLNPIIAVDTETTGLDVYVDVIAGISLTLPSENRHFYIPIDPTADERSLPSAEVIQAIKPLMEEERIGKVFHNAIYDINMFKRHGVEVKGLAWDTQTGMHLLNENEPSYALKNLATKYLGEPSDTFSELFGKGAKFADVPLDIALVYAAKDTDLTWRLYEFQRLHMEKMPNALAYYQTVEVPLLNAIVDMERTGFEIDTEYAKEYGKEMKAEIDRIEQSILTQVGDININSGQQLKPELERLTGVELENLDAKRTLKPLKNKYPIIAELLHYKELTKLYSTYISVLPEKVHPITNRLHARFNPMGTVTGRFSSGGNGVNLQNQPKDARKLFVAPKGHIIIGGDWSQQEVRCAAHFTQEPTLLTAYAQGKDVYTSMASDFYGKPYEECGDGTSERKAMKVIVLAVMYGMGPGALASSLGISDKEAKAFMSDFFEKMPNVKRWIDETQEYAKKNGFVWMDKEQRKRRLPDAKKAGRGYNPDASRAMRQGPNAVIQGTSAIQTKTTIIALHELCKRKGWQLWATVHDEMLLLVPDTINREDVEDFRSVMVNTYQFGNVVNKTDIELMTVWGEGIGVEEWFAKKETEETE